MIWRWALRLALLLALVVGWLVAVEPSGHSSGDWFPQADKLRHAAAFAAFALLACAARIRVSWAALGLMAYGVGIEFAQMFVPGRDASWGDVLADAAGIAAGLAAAPMLAAYLRARWPGLGASADD